MGRIGVVGRSRFEATNGGSNVIGVRTAADTEEVSVRTTTGNDRRRSRRRFGGRHHFVVWEYVSTHSFSVIPIVAWVIAFEEAEFALLTSSASSVRVGTSPRKCGIAR